ncbi:hypothetical protein ECZU25_11030 [Escherichia coli]|nr:hypothetical protein ECZU24_19350 [Escherichia coli]GHL24290.1 hypothetical protein ECZU25_11030 [Escherichia coli]
MKTALLLEKLEGQLATLRQRCAPVAQFATLSARFDRHLFQTRATTLQACLDEAGDNRLRFVMPLSNSNCRKSPGWRNIWRRNWRL